jgi:hypothetical protein
VSLFRYEQNSTGRVVKLICVDSLYPFSEDEADLRDRVLEFRERNLFETQDIGQADAILLETDIHRDSFKTLVKMFETKVKSSARVLMLRALEKIYSDAKTQLVSFKKLNEDLFKTTWQPIKGYNLAVWQKT